MGSLLAAAETRKRDQLRAKEKMLQREREQEGDEFADKEKFVTAAYKAQQEEMKRLEEEERQREEQEERMKGKVGMRGFYRNMMDSDEQRHREMIEAMQEGQKGAPKKEDDEASKEKTEAELAREMNEKGAKVILNDEGQVADKRQLLSAGLNVRAKPKVAAPAPTLPSRTSDAQQAYQGRNSDKRGMRERQSRMIERQLEEAAKRAADEEDEKRRELEHKAKSRKTEKDVSSAKERYLQRKREKELEAAAAKGT
ncbi:coiled-coil domain-containing protein 55-domain containing protein [Lineolata rhizophorae]|uniref:Coiled-coil domain-containing protein 55-domain containing protein n=1 Tax=Lineolata rhizophorae TaxID=578093 RepID=A0A6A6NYW7_9PEZI|nr:coiled-coil domain-containing protein 55-domain containing protein [Lineolata rhizophorae]